MAKIRLVIAESDETYVEKLVNYLMANHLSKFNVKYFTDLGAFSEFLADTNETIDILLACPKMYKVSSAATAISKVKTLIMLSGGGTINSNQDIKSIEKYQRADKIVSDMLDLFLCNQDSEVLLPQSARHTQVVGVYSPAGGTGKTTVAVGLSAELSRQRLPAFYLNMEDIPSTEAFFDYSETRGLSDIFFYLKEQGSNIALKIESIKNTDNSRNIQYFAPPSGVTEVDDMSPNELVELIQSMKRMAHHDYIVLDLSCGLNARNIALFDVCDTILLVGTQDAIFNAKYRAFQRAIDEIAAKYNVDIRDKIINIQNKHGLSLTKRSDKGGMGAPVCDIKIPFIADDVERAIQEHLKPVVEGLNYGARQTAG